MLRHAQVCAAYLATGCGAVSGVHRVADLVIDRAKRTWFHTLMIVPSSSNRVQGFLRALSLIICSRKCRIGQCSVSPIPLDSLTAKASASSTSICAKM